MPNIPESKLNPWGVGVGSVVKPIPGEELDPWSKPVSREEITSIPESELDPWAPPPEPGLFKELGKGIATGVIGMHKAVGSVLEYVPKALGVGPIPGISPEPEKPLFGGDLGKTTREFWAEKEKPFEAAVPNMLEIKSIPEFGRWAAWNVGQMGAQIAMMAPFMGVGGAAATTRAKSLLNAGDVAGAMKIFTKATRLEQIPTGGKALMDLIKRSPGAPGRFGEFLAEWARLKPIDIPIGLLEAGQITEGQLERLQRGEVDELNPIRALAATFVASKLEYLGAEGAINRLIGGANKATGNLIRRIATGALAVGVAEGTEEFFQQYAEQFGIDPTNTFTKQQFLNSVNAAGAGFIGGFFLGGGGAAIPPSGRETPIQQQLKGDPLNQGIEALITDPTLAEEAKFVEIPGIPVPPWVVPPVDIGVPPIPEMPPIIGKAGIPTEPTGELVPKIETGGRRVDLERRKRVSEMTPEEREQALMVDDLTGLKNKRAYEEADRQPVQSLIDVDGLKYVNDTFGHEAGDELLRKVGDALSRAVGEDGNSYHFSGDEFALEGKTHEEVASIAEMAKQILREEPMEFDGRQYTPDFSYGIGNTMAEADVLMRKDKADRIARGQAAERGRALEAIEEIPPGAVMVSPAPGEVIPPAGEVVPPAGEEARVPEEVPPEVIPKIKEPIWRQSQRFPTKSAAQLQSTLASDRLAKELGLEGSWQLERRVVKAPTGSGYVYEYRPIAEVAPPVTEAIPEVEKPAGITDIETELATMSDEDIDALDVAPVAPAPPAVTPALPGRPIERIPEVVPAPPVPPVVPAPRGAADMTQALNIATRHGLEGASEAIKGLYELFGGGVLKTFPGGIDADTYAKAKPHFETAFQHAVDMGKSVKEFYDIAVEMLGNTIKPYLKHFLKTKRDAIVTEAPELALEGAEERGKVVGVARPKGRKLRDVGEIMEGKRAARDYSSRAKAIKITLDETVVGEPAAIIKAILKLTTKSDIFKIDLNVPGRTPGLGRWLTGFRSSLAGFLQYGGQEVGGGRRKYRKSFHDALVDAATTPEGQEAVRNDAAKYISILQEIQDATKDALTIEQAVENIYSKVLFPGKTRLDFEKAGYGGALFLSDFGRDVLVSRLIRNSVFRSQLGRIATRLQSTEGDMTKNLPIIRPNINILNIETSDEHRHGENKTGDDLIEAFGFRGIEFGEWTEVLHRQKSVNLTFDSFCDLAKIIKAPLKGISLWQAPSQRSLGIAFGSRGHGLPAAHYEPGNHVINLTKTRGDGSLGHEWMHGIHSVRIMHQGVNVLSDVIDTLRTEYRLEDLESRVEEILRGLDATISKYSITGNRLEDAQRYLTEIWEHDLRRDTKFYSDAVKLDGGVKGKYWSKENEMLSRAFEGYLADELQGENLYLVNTAYVAPGTVEAMFNREAGAYPSEAERERFNTIFSRLFDGMNWAEDGTVTMDDDYALVSEQQKRDAQIVIDGLLAKLDEQYALIYKGEQSEDGLYWYAYNATERGVTMQPINYAGFDDTFALEGVVEGRGAVAYTDVLSADDVVKYRLTPVVHVRNDTTIYTKEGEYVIQPGVISEEAVERGEAEYVPGAGEGRPPGRGVGVGVGEGYGRAGIPHPEGPPTLAGEGIGIEPLEPPLGSGTGHLDTGSDALFTERIDFVLHSNDLPVNVTKITAFTDNLAAIRVLKQIESENRFATPEEQKILIRFHGWGNLSEALARSPVEGWIERAGMLRTELTENELREARTNILSGYYTPPDIIASLYHILSRFGFSGGRILDPAFGIGHFFGMMPEMMRRNSVVNAVEKDDIGARIGQQLYQNVRVINNVFEETALPAGYYDLAMTNVPFGEHAPYDAIHNQENFLLHDYFIDKQLSLLRPGGLLIAITSKGTMDKFNNHARQAFSEKADLIGAIRLPSGAFKAQGTEVVTDILFLRKRFDREGVGGAKFLNTSRKEFAPTGTQTYGWDDNINEYFLANPDMVLGEMAMQEQGKWNEPALIVNGNTENLGEQIDEIAKNFPENLYVKEEVRVVTDIADQIPAVNFIKDGGIFEKDDILWRNDAGVSVPWEPNIKGGKDAEIIPGMTPEGYVRYIKAMMRHYTTIRSIMRDLLKAQYKNDPVMDVFRKKLNDEYGSFVKKYGNLNKSRNLKHILEDPDGGSIAAIERWNYEEEKLESLAAILTQNTAKLAIPPVSAGNSPEALVYSLAWKGRVDLAYMENLSGIKRADIIEQLKGHIYDDPKIGWVPADEYLSGNVRDKLREAEAAVEVDSKYEENVRQLRAIIPIDLESYQIPVQLGASWLNPTVVSTFMGDLMERSGTLAANFIPAINQWTIEITGHTKTDTDWRRKKIKASIAAQSTWGTQRVDFLDLMEYALNGGMPKVYGGGRFTVKDENGNDKHLFNPEETDAAVAKLEDIKDRFRVWLWEDDVRSVESTRRYNDIHNQIVDRQFDGSHLQLPGKVPDEIVKLLPHQFNAIWRFLTTGKAYLAHEVGTGKTFIMIASIMESRRLGLANKPAFAVKSANIDQIRAAFYQLYPGANLITVDMLGDAKKRRADMNKIANENYDAVLMTHETLQRIKVSPETEGDFIRNEIKRMERALLAEESRRWKGKKTLAERILQNKLAKLESKLKRLLDTPKEEDVPTFEEMGIDMLVVDEAHIYKNLDIQTNYQNIKGIASAESYRASDFYMKTQYITERFGRGLLFASGTPLSNSIGELYSLQRHFQGKELQDEGLDGFDQWAHTFGDIGQEAEPSPEGTGFRMITKFKKFRGIPELTAKIRKFADIITADEVGIPRPVIANANGRPEMVIIPQSQSVKDYQKILIQRVDAIRANPGHATDRPPGLPKSHVHSWSNGVCSTCGTKWTGALYGGVPDNVLRILNDGRNMAIDPRIVDPSLPDNPDTKVNYAVKKIMELYQKPHPAKDPITGDFYLEPKNVQLIFSDRGVPYQKRFSIYEDIKRKLIAKGIPAGEIAFIQDAAIAKGDKHAKEMTKRKILTRATEGGIRILLGGTQNLGTGVNVQDRVIGIHNLDSDWNAANLTQRLGRGIRRGNRYEGVYVYNYGTLKTVDNFMWDTVARKSIIMEQVLSRNPLIREVEDISKTSMDAKEMSALLSDDPLVQEKFTLESDIRRLRSQLAVYDHTKRSQLAELQALPQYIKGWTESLNSVEKSNKIIQQATAIRIEESITGVEDRDYSVEKDGGKINELAQKVFTPEILSAHFKKVVKLKPEQRLLNDVPFGQLGYIESSEIKVVDEKTKKEKAVATEKFTPIDVRVKIIPPLFSNKQPTFGVRTGARVKTETHEVSSGFARALTAFKNEHAKQIADLDAQISNATVKIVKLEEAIKGEFPKKNELREKQERMNAVASQLLENQRNAEGQRRLTHEKQTNEIENTFIVEDSHEENSEQYSVEAEKEEGVIGRSITIDDVQSIFPGQQVEQFGEDFTVKLKNGASVAIQRVASITPDEISLLVGHGIAALKPGQVVPGIYEPGVIRIIHGKRTMWTLAHESIHWLEDIGIISKQDQIIIEDEAKRDGTWKNKLADYENRANWLATFLTKSRPSRTILQKIWDKINNFIDRIAGIRTAEMIGEELRTGEIFEKVPLQVPVTVAPEFYTLSDVVKRGIDAAYSTFTDNPQNLPPDQKKLYDDYIHTQKDFKWYDNAFSVPYRMAQKYPEWKEAWRIHGIVRPESRSELSASFIRIAEPFLTLRKLLKGDGFTPSQIRESIDRVERVLIAGDIILHDRLASLKEQAQGLSGDARKEIENKISELRTLRRFNDQELKEGIVDEYGKKTKLGGREIAAYVSVRKSMDDMMTFMIDWATNQVFRGHKNKKWYTLLLQAAEMDLGKEYVQTLLGEKGLDAAAINYMKNIRGNLGGIFDRIEKKIATIPEEEISAVGEKYNKLVQGVSEELTETQKYVRVITGVTSPEELTKLTRDMFAAYVQTRPQLKQIKALRNQIGDWVGYFPRYRDRGEHKIRLVEQIYDPETGDLIEERPIHSEMFTDKNKYAETYEKIMNLYADQRGKLPPNYVITLEPVGISPEMAFQGVSDINMQKIFDDAISGLKMQEVYYDKAGNKVDVQEQLRDAGLQAIANQFKKRGAMKVSIHRSKKYGTIKGYDETDLHRVFLNYISSMSGLMTKQVAAADFMDLMKDVDNPAMFVGLAIYNREMLRNDSRGDQISGKIRSFAFLWYLGGLMKSAVVNLTQNPIVGFAELSKYMRENKIGGAGDVVYAKAMVDVLRDKTSEIEKRVIHEMVGKGIASDKYIQSIFEGLQEKESQQVLAIMRWIATPFSMSEIYNRKSAAVALFRVAYPMYQKRGLSETEAYGKAFDDVRTFIDNVHYAYGKTNRPLWMQSGDALSTALKTFYTFRGYTHNFVARQAELLSTKDFRTVLHTLAYMAIFGGLMGLPFFKDLFEWIEKEFGYSPMKVIRQSLRGLGGDTLEKFGVSGLPSVFGANISGSLAIGLPWPIGSETPEETVFGVYGGLLEKGKRAVQSAMVGDFGRTAAEVSPEFIRNPLVAMRESAFGQEMFGAQGYATTPRGRPMYDIEGRPISIKGTEVALKALGFLPTESARERELNRIIQHQERWAAEKKARAGERFRIARIQKDPDALKNLIRDVRDINAGIHARGIEKLVPRANVSRIIQASRQPRGAKEKRERRYKQLEF